MGATFPCGMSRNGWDSIIWSQPFSERRGPFGWDCVCDTAVFPEVPVDCSAVLGSVNRALEVYSKLFC